MKYHPRAGYTYMPEARWRVPSPRGGYLVRANAAGFRSEHEFVPERQPGTFRVLLFGDSQTAGDGVGNAGRYSDLLEKAVPGLEVYNYAVGGQAPDQQLLLFQEQTEIERDLVVVGMYVENIRRITTRLVKQRDTNGEVVFRAKPYFELEDDELVLHNVPVPKEAWTEETLPEEFRPHVYAHGVGERLVDHLKGALQRAPLTAPLRRAVKSAAMRLKRLDPVPEYDSPKDPVWLLLRKILETFVHESRAPVLLILIPHYFFLSERSDPSAYQARYRELEEATGCHVFDPLPGLLALTAEERSALWSDEAGHLSARGHEILARMLVPWMHRLLREREGATPELAAEPAASEP